MVVAILVSQIAPSSRGLQQRGAQIAGLINPDNGYQKFNEESNGSSAHRRKPFKAISALTSIASDLDIIFDWYFFVDAFTKDKQYRTNYREGDAEGDSPYLVPPLLLSLTLCSCVFGTLMWLVLATDGRIISPFMRRIGYDKISMGHMLFLCVLTEDIPQIVLTFLIDDCFEEDANLSNVAICNLMASLYDMLIKIAESYDERHDVVETGDWLKGSFRAHKDTVTSLVEIPLPPPVQYDHEISKSHHIPLQSQANGQSRPHLNRQQTQSSFIVEAALLHIAPMQVPRLRFITTSLDKTIRLWDTAPSHAGHRRDKCIRTFRGHLNGVTCIAFLGNSQHLPDSWNKNTHYQAEKVDQTTFFVTGCNDGYAKMWNLHGDCIRSYYLPPRNVKENGVTCITALGELSTFACGYKDGTAKYWGAWSGICIAVYSGHSTKVTSICSMMDSHSFLTGSMDGTVKVWNSKLATESLLVADSACFNMPLSTQNIHEESVCKQSFENPLHSSVLSMVCMKRSNVFCSGSADGCARLWSIDSGKCLHTFVGHSGPVTAMAIIDDVTLLTGSGDKTIMAWDALTGVCLRTFSDHSGAVTSIMVAHDNRTFITTSVDKTVKIWVVTSVMPAMQSTISLDPLLEASGGVCHS